MMHIPKKYGHSRIDRCPFCERQATAVNKQGIPVCISHRESELKGLRCVCGESLDVMNGRYGAYFSCVRCGNMSFRKALEINDVRNKAAKSGKAPGRPDKERKEITVRSDDPRYFP